MRTSPGVVDREWRSRGDYAALIRIFRGDANEVCSANHVSPVSWGTPARLSCRPTSNCCVVVKIELRPEP